MNETALGDSPKRFGFFDEFADLSFIGTVRGNLPWRGGEPSSSSNKCVEWDPCDGCEKEHRSWKDVSCESNSLGYLCRRQCPTVAPTSTPIVFIDSENDDDIVEFVVGTQPLLFSMVAIAILLFIFLAMFWFMTRTRTKLGKALETHLNTLEESHS